MAKVMEKGISQQTIKTVIYTKTRTALDARRCPGGSKIHLIIKNGQTADIAT